MTEVLVSTSPANGSNKKKKSQKPKKPVDIEKYQVFVSGPIAARVSVARGRHFVATKPIQKGTTVFIEKASVFVVRNALDTCSFCIESIPTNPEQQQQINVNDTPSSNSEPNGVSVVSCQDCQHAFYCSKEHMEADSEKHAFECKTLAKLDALVEKHGSDVGTIKLLLAFLSTVYLEKQGKRHPQKDAIPIDLLEDLPTHREAFESDWIKSLTKVLEELAEYIPKDIFIPIAEMINICCRIATYAFVLPEAKFRTVDAAYGLLPMASLFFNHSCTPNCFISGDKGGRVAFRTIRDIAPDEDLNVAFGDTNLLTFSRDERRGHLLIQKHIWCKCKRCASPITKSVDQYLNGILCEVCNAGRKKPITSSHGSGEIEPSFMNDLPVHIVPPRNPEMILTAARLKQAGKELPQLKYACSKCDNELLQSEMEAFLLNVDAEYRLCIELLRAAPKGETQKDRQLSQTRNRMVARQKLCEFLLKYDGSETLIGLLHGNTYGNKSDVSLLNERKLHPWNSFINNVIPMLMNCSISLNDLDTAAKLQRNILSRLNAMDSLPEPMRAEWYVNLGDILTEIASRQTKSGHPTLSKKARNEARQMYKKGLELRKISHVKDHPFIKVLERKLNDLAKD